MRILGLYIVLIHFSFFAGAQTAIPDSPKKNIPANPGDSEKVSARQRLIIDKTVDAFEMASKNADSSFLLSREALASSINENFFKGIGSAYNSLGWAHLHKGSYDSSIFYLTGAKKIFSADNSYEDLAKANINLAEVYTKQSDFSSGIKSLLEAELSAKKANSPIVLTDIKRQLGIIYRETGDNANAARYLKEAMEGFLQLKDDRRFVNTSVSLGILYNTMSLPDSCLSVLNRSLKIAARAPGNEYEMAMLNEHIGQAFLLKGEYERTLDHFVRAYRIFEKIENWADISYEALNIGRAEMKLKHYENAKAYFLRAHKMNDSLNLMNYQEEVLKELAGLYQAKGNWEKAYHYLEQSIALSDSLSLSSNITRTTLLKEQYEGDKKEQEIALLKKNNELNVLKLKQQKAVQYGAVIVFALIIVIAVVSIGRYRTMHNANRIIEIEQMRNNIASDLHDDIGSTLTSMNILSKMVLQQASGDEIMNANLQRLKDHSGLIMESMADIVWAINPHNDSLEKVIYRMKEFAAEILEPLNINYTFRQQGDFSSLQLTPQKRKDLFLIFKETINNAAKYSFCDKIEIALENKKESIHLIVTDNGQGFKENTVRKGNGLRNMRERAKGLKGQLDLDSAIGTGTTISLVIPFP